MTATPRERAQLHRPRRLRAQRAAEARGARRQLWRTSRSGGRRAGRRAGGRGGALKFSEEVAGVEEVERSSSLSMNALKAAGVPRMTAFSAVATAASARAAAVGGGSPVEGEARASPCAAEPRSRKTALHAGANAQLRRARSVDEGVGAEERASSGEMTVVARPIASRSGRPPPPPARSRRASSRRRRRGRSTKPVENSNSRKRGRTCGAPRRPHAQDVRA